MTIRGRQTRAIGNAAPERTQELGLWLAVPDQAKAGTVLTLSMSQSGGQAFRVWSEAGAQWLGVFLHTGDPVLSTEFEADGSSTVIVYIEAVDEGSATLTLSGQDSGPCAGSSSDSCNVNTGGKGVGDLDVAKISHNDADGVLAENLEDTVGAFVPVNNDDDDYSATRPAAGVDYGMDKDQAGQVVGENDLIPIYVSAIAPGAKIKLLGGGNIYNSADRSGGAIQGQQMDAPTADRTFYVECLRVGKPSVALYVNGKPADEVKITAFQWAGPLNVPQWGTYEYKTTGAPPGSQWNDGAEDFSLTSGEGTSDVQVRWGAGPMVGKLNYIVNDNYNWDLEVNVVQIHVIDVNQAADFTPTGTTVVGAQGYNDKKGIGPGKKVTSWTPATQAEAIHWYATVELNGPGNNRGVKQMDVGFIQNLGVTALKTTFANQAGITRSTLEGKRYWDTISQGQNAGKPFYDLTPPARFTGADYTAHGNSKRIESADSPFVTFPIYPDKHHQANVISRLDLQWDFDLYIAAKTIDKRNAANLGLTAEAESQWRWNSSSAIDAATHKFPAGQAAIHPTSLSGWSNLYGGASMLGPADTKRFNTLVDDNSHWFMKVD